ncbi:MAG: G5 domain-containing protein [Anaerolineae bacterium]|nr:G5 domain-containing protein [Anaerolineae bacterium]
MHRARLLVIGMLLAAGLTVLLGGCQAEPPPMEVTIFADGNAIQVSLPGGTVRDALAAAGVSVGGLDRVIPDLWEEVHPGLQIRVVRVREVEEVQRRAIPFSRRVLRSEALSDGESRVVQLGQEGEEEIVYKVVLEDGVEVQRVEVSRQVVRPVVHEVLVVGVQGNLPSVPITGTIAYISGGNAWMMRAESGGRRPLTAAGDLDGRVFALSPDGRWLLFSRMVTDTASSHLNALWVVGTTVVGQEAWPLGIQDVLHAQWDQEARRIAYTTAERSQGSPGWKAHNDLWVAEVLLPSPHVTPTLALPVVTPTLALAQMPGGAYPWWGTTFAWSPDGEHMAYATANSVGVIHLPTKEVRELLAFPEYHTYAEWVWTPSLSWSPDGRYLVCTAHAAGPGDLVPQDSPLFHVYGVRLDGRARAPLAEAVGMWANPQWTGAEGAGPWAIAYGQSRSPTNSQESQYDLFLMDRDGSDKLRLFPAPEDPGLVAPQFAWSPEGTHLVTVWQGDLYLVEVPTGRAHQLTADGNSGRPQWSR